MIERILWLIYNLPHIIKIRISPTINKWNLKAKGVSYGKNICIMGNLRICGTGNITIGDNFMMTNGEAVNPISSNLKGCFFTEHEAQISIGKNVGMSSTRLWISKGLFIGDNVKIGACSLIIDTDTHPVNYIVRRTCNEGALSAPITIKNDAWIGAHCIILKGVTIGERSIIGAGSVVTKNIPADCIAAGNPCKIIKYLK